MRRVEGLGRQFRRIRWVCPRMQRRDRVNYPFPTGLQVSLDRLLGNIGRSRGDRGSDFAMLGTNVEHLRIVARRLNP